MSQFDKNYVRKIMQCHLSRFQRTALTLLWQLQNFSVLSNKRHGGKSGAKRYDVPRRPEVFNSPHQILTLLNKFPGYWLQGETDLANKPRILQIFPHSKFGINWTAGLKVMAKKFKFRPRNFLAITFKPAVRLIPNFECEKICTFLGLFANSVSPWSQ